MDELNEKSFVPWHYQGYSAQIRVEQDDEVYNLIWTEQSMEI